MRSNGFNFSPDQATVSFKREDNRDNQLFYDPANLFSVSGIMKELASIGSSQPILWYDLNKDEFKSLLNINH